MNVKKYLSRILIGLGGFGALMLVFGYMLYTGPGPLQRPTMYMVPQGYSVSLIAQRFAQDRVINSALVFKLAARLTGRDKSLQAGEYALPPGISSQQLLHKLSAGDTYRRSFTVPEGLTSWQVMTLLENIILLEGDILVAPDEGTLLPETYGYMRGDARADKIAMMQRAMERTLQELWENRAADLPLTTPHEALVLASIIEKETGVADERDQVAGVFINRLRRNMRLQSDPTVIYALTLGKMEEGGQGPLGRRLLRADLDFDSPYNTYRYAGLPPGPIANPGRASIAAALNPAQHDYIYFVADGSGGHAFARTYEEHRANVARWRQIRDSR